MGPGKASAAPLWGALLSPLLHSPAAGTQKCPVTGVGGSRFRDGELLSSSETGPQPPPAPGPSSGSKRKEREKKHFIVRETILPIVSVAAASLREEVRIE